MNDPYAYIREGLQRWHNFHRKQRGLSSGSPQLQMNAPLSEKEILEFETIHWISLPQEYRGFLINVTKGGPFCCVFEFGQRDTDGSWKENDGFVGVLSEPFPHVSHWNDLTGMPNYERNREDEEGYVDGYYERKLEWGDRHYWNTKFVNGAIPLCHSGCGYHPWLIVTGSEAGNVWDDDRMDNAGFKPTQLDGLERVTFLRWYLARLNQVLQQIRE